MDFVEIGSVNPISVVISLAFAAAMVGGAVLFFKAEHIWGFVGIFLFIGGTLGFALGLSSLSRIPLAAQKLEVGEQIEAVYGLELTMDQLTELDYPAREPESDFEVFGSLSIDEQTEDGFERTEVFLIWRDSEMALAGSPDGETFTELKR